MFKMDKEWFNLGLIPLMTVQQFTNLLKMITILNIIILEQILKPFNNLVPIKKYKSKKTPLDIEILITIFIALVQTNLILPEQIYR